MSKTYISANLRRLVAERAEYCCEYCRIPEYLSLSSHQIDHIIAEKHGGPTQASNLALSCTLCNQAKGSDIASLDHQTQEVVRLYHPRKDRWADHFVLDSSTGEIRPLTGVGQVTIQLLNFNRSQAVKLRHTLISAGLSPFQSLSNPHQD